MPGLLYVILKLLCPHGGLHVVIFPFLLSRWLKLQPNQVRISLVNFILNGVLSELFIEKRILNQRYNVVSDLSSKVQLTLVHLLKPLSVLIFLSFPSITGNVDEVVIIWLFQGEHFPWSEVASQSFLGRYSLYISLQLYSWNEYLCNESMVLLRHG